MVAKGTGQEKWGDGGPGARRGVQGGFAGVETPICPKLRCEAQCRVVREPGSPRVP